MSESPNGSLYLWKTCFPLFFLSFFFFPSVKLDTNTKHTEKSQANDRKKLPYSHSYWVLLLKAGLSFSTPRIQH